MVNETLPDGVQPAILAGRAAAHGPFCRAGRGPSATTAARHLRMRVLFHMPLIDLI
jgi:hypothetical protein